MTEFKIIGNKENKIFDHFISSLDDAKEFDWAPAYGTYSAFRKIEGSFNSFIKRGGASRAIFDLAEGITDPDLIEELITHPGDSKCKVFLGDDETFGKFHHKVYLFIGENKSSFLIGSSNFTSNGLSKNHETDVYFNDSQDTPIFKFAREYFENDIWNAPGAVYPVGNQDILEAYREIYRKRSKSQSKHKKELKKLKEAVEVQYKYEISNEKFNPRMAYLSGILCACAQSFLSDSDIINKKINLHFKSNIMNSDDPDNKGYICAKLDNTLLGDIRLNQHETLSKAMRSIYSELRTLLLTDSNKNEIKIKDHTDRMTKIDFELSFSDESKLWPMVLSVLEQFSKVTGRGRQREQYVPAVPSEVILSDDSYIKQKFLQGYFAFRSRISKGDRYPRGRLRIGLQISTHALDFAEQIKSLIEEFGLSPQLADGTRRNRDHIIRFLPDTTTLSFFDLGWQRMLVKEFVKFNEANFPS